MLKNVRSGKARSKVCQVDKTGAASMSNPIMGLIPINKNIMYVTTITLTSDTK